MTATAVRFDRTRSANRNRRVKADRLVAAAVALGMTVCELRSTHPDAKRLRSAVSKRAEVRSASSTTWCAVVRLLDDRLMVDATRRCPACGSPVREALTPTVPRLLVEPLPHVDGLLARTSSHLRVLHLERVTAGAPVGRPAQQRWREHRLACPASPEVQHRASRRRRCPACHYPMSPLWANEPAVVLHPTCEEST